MGKVTYSPPPLSPNIVDLLLLIRAFLCRWFIYDAVSHMAFGEPIGFVRNGRDVGGLIEAFHEMAPLAGLVAALPWLMNPILKNPVLGRFFMPKAGDGSGTGRIMLVSRKLRVYL